VKFVRSEGLKFSEYIKQNEKEVYDDFQSIVTEGKQIGTVYHFTTNKGIMMMTDEELLKRHGMEMFELVSLNNFISLTRNPSLADNLFGHISKKRGYYVRLNIDGDKLSNKYKIKPIRGVMTDDNPFNNDNKVPREWEENEEIVIPKGKSLKMKPYITSITFSGNDKMFDTVKKRLDIPVYYKRKFTNCNENREMFNFIDRYELYVEI
jgi:hypothetical protein